MGCELDLLDPRRAASDVVAARRPFNNTSTFAAAAGPRRVFYLLTTPAPRRRARTPRRRRGARARTPRRRAVPRQATRRARALRRQRRQNPETVHAFAAMTASPSEHLYLVDGHVRAPARAPITPARGGARSRSRRTKSCGTLSHDDFTTKQRHPAHDRPIAKVLNHERWRGRRGADFPKYPVPRVCRRKSRVIL